MGQERETLTAEPTEAVEVTGECVLGGLRDAIVARWAGGVDRHLRGDVYVGSMAAKTRMIPGQNTLAGQVVIGAYMEEVLDKTRDRIASGASFSQQ